MTTTTSAARSRLPIDKALTGHPLSCAMTASRALLGTLALIACIAGAATPAAAGQGKNEPSSLVCEFDHGQASTFDGDAFKTKQPAPLNFLIVDVDLEKQTARISTGDAGTMGTLKIVRALNANHFIEVLNEGFLTLTTVYDGDGSEGRHPAVHARHMGVLGQPVVAHYNGFCRNR